MTLADTSVWIDHQRRGNDQLRALLLLNQVLCHDLIIEELACGNLKNRDRVLRDLENLPKLPLSSHREVSDLIERQKFMGKGLGPIDVHLLSAALFASVNFITLDKRLNFAWKKIKSSRPAP